MITIYLLRHCAVVAPFCAGFGANFWGETVGQGIALLEYYRALEAGEIAAL